MSLSEEQKVRLREAIQDYGFPPNYFDFSSNTPNPLANTTAVEVAIGRQLKSGDSGQVRDGLSNVLYWGYGKMGIRDTRIQRFREKATIFQLKKASELFRRPHMPSVVEIKKLALPEFSGLSFVSKVRMFLNPDKSATLDLQIMKIHKWCPTTLLAGLTLGKSTQIRITARNSDVYEAWCRKMADISRVYFDGRFRAVDVERGLFELIQRGNVDIAARIFNEA